MSLIDEITYSDRVSEIETVQFGLLSPERIRAQSVALVYKPLTNPSNTVGTIDDPRLGATEKNPINYVSKLNLKQDPGHFGHLELAKPVIISSQNHKFIIKILNSICYRCANLRIDKENTSLINNIRLKQGKNRFAFVTNKAGEAKDPCPECGAKKVKFKDPRDQDQVFKIVADLQTATQKKRGKKAKTETEPETEPSNTVGTIDDEEISEDEEEDEEEDKIKPATEPIATNETEDQDDKEQKLESEVEELKLLKNFNAEICLNILTRISDQDIVLMGLNPDFARPEWMIWTVMPIPPPSMRPSVETEDGLTSSDDLTNKLNEIVKTNHALVGLLELEMSEKDLEAAKRPKNTTGVCNKIDSKILEQWCLLQYHVATYIDNEISNVKKATSSRSSRPLKTLRQRIKSKKGRIRRNLMGKRVNYSARSVITPDANLSIDQVGVPQSIAMNLTWPETVTKYNLEFLTGLVRNGPYKYPGANYIKEDVLTVEGIVRPQMRQLKYLDYENKVLSIGSTVFRHIMDDDVVFFNRQPSLHRMSMMAHRAKVLPIGNTFRLNTQVTSPYNADFDGDEMNAHMPRSLQTKVELQVLTSVPTQIVSPQASKPVMGLVQDSLLGNYRYTSSQSRYHPGLVSNWEIYYQTGFDDTGTTTPADIPEMDETGMDDIFWIWSQPDIKKPLKTATEKLGPDHPVTKILQEQYQISISEETPVPEKWAMMGYYAGSLNYYWNPGTLETEMETAEAKIKTKQKVKEEAEKAEPKNSKTACVTEKKKPSTPLKDIKDQYYSLGLHLPTAYLSQPARFNLIETMHTLQSTDKYSGILPEPDLIKDGELYWSAQKTVSYTLPEVTYQKGNIKIRNGDMTPDSVFDNSTVGKGANSLIHVTWNDFGPETTRQLFDNLAQLANHWLLKGGFSVGFRDIEINPALSKFNRETLKGDIYNIHREYIDKVHQGFYQKESRPSIRDQFEMDINIALNQVRSKIENQTYSEVVPWNRIHNMVTSGSKGKKNNIVQIMAMLGQQDLEGNRIPDYFYRRTLPHLYKDSIEPEAKGFIIDSFMVGLNPTNYWFHAQSGRIGVISTSIKTAETGYIQRKLIKVMEDAQVATDGTVRNSLNLILQFFYGDDGFDACHLESNPIKPVISPESNFSPETGLVKKVENMTNYYFSSFQLFTNVFKWSEDELNNLSNLIYPTANTTEIPIDLNTIKEATDQEFEMLKEAREILRTEMFPGTVPEKMMLPLNITRLITNVIVRMPSSLPVSDLNPVTVIEEVKAMTDKIKRESSHFVNIQEYATRQLLATILSNLSSKRLIYMRITKLQFKIILEQIYQKILEAYIAPGEMVGAISAQSIGEPTTQLTLNVFHSTGQGSAANVSRGVPRMKEIMDLSKNPKTPSYSLTLRDWKLYEGVSEEGVRFSVDPEQYEKDISKIKQNVKSVMNKLTNTTLQDLSESVRVVGYTLGSDVSNFSKIDQQIIEIYKQQSAEANEDSETEGTEVEETAETEGTEVEETAETEGTEVEETAETDAETERSEVKATAETDAETERSEVKATAETDAETEQVEATAETERSEVKATAEVEATEETEKSEVEEGQTVWIINFKIKPEALVGLSEFDGRLEIIYLNLLKTEAGIKSGGPGKKKWKNLDLDYYWSDQQDQDNLYFQVVVNDLGDRDDDPTNSLRFLTKKIGSSQIRGIQGIEQAYCRENKETLEKEDGSLIPPSSDEYNEWKTSRDYNLIIDTNNKVSNHSMYQIFNMDEIDPTKVYSNNIQEIMSVLGIEAARRVIAEEATDVLEFAGTHINRRHIGLLSDVMTVQGYLVPVSRYGVNKSDNGPWSRASFEETASQVSNAALFSEEDPMTGVTPNIMFGQFIKAGTNSFDILVDEQIIESVEPPKQNVSVPKSDRRRVQLQAIKEEYCFRPENFRFTFVLA